MMIVSLTRAKMEDFVKWVGHKFDVENINFFVPN